VCNTISLYWFKKQQITNSNVEKEKKKEKQQKSESFTEVNNYKKMK